MRWISVICLALALSAAALHAASPDQTYIQLYNLILEGDELQQTGQAALARNRYLDAQKGLLELQKISPSWNKTIVEYRLKYLSNKLGGDTAPATTPQPEPTRPTPGQQAPGRPQPAQPGRPAPDQREAQIQQLNQMVAHLQGEVSTLNEKLKEALAVQPAAVDPRELKKAEEQLRVLQQERDVLELALKQEKSKKAADPAELQAARKEAEELKAQVAEQFKERVALAKQVEEANAQLAKASKPEGNSRMERQLQETREELEKRELSLSAAQKELKRLQDEVSGRDDKASAKKIAKLEKERADLEKDVEKLKQDLKKKNSKNDTRELAALRARVQALEAQKQPYTAEELGLMKAPPVANIAASAATEPTTVAANPARRSGPQIPAGAGGMVREAQQAFAARRYDEAEEKYVQALKLDENNVYTLANLGAVQIEANKLPEAEKTLARAIAADPEDGFSHMLFGILKFRQEKFDEALDHLSRAAQLDPTNAEAHNYLGITLSQKGQRGPAEAALRKALSLSPNNPGAHHNLAVIYATQTPSFPQLANYHYQRAVASGHPKNADLEKKIADSVGK